MSAGPAYPIGKRVFALWGNDGGRSDCFWAESNGVFSPCAGLKPSIGEAVELLSVVLISGTGHGRLTIRLIPEITWYVLFLSSLGL